MDKQNVDFVLPGKISADAHVVQEQGWKRTPKSFDLPKIWQNLNNVGKKCWSFYIF